jgi:hypothetical protein
MAVATAIIATAAAVGVSAVAKTAEYEAKRKAEGDRDRALTQFEKMQQKEMKRAQAVQLQQRIEKVNKLRGQLFGNKNMAQGGAITSPGGAATRPIPSDISEGGEEMLG